MQNFHFLDSLNYLPMSLKNMPKSFNLTCKKGYYTHIFNTAINLNYVGAYPEPELYGQTMSVDERTQSMQWHITSCYNIVHLQ